MSLDTADLQEIKKIIESANNRQVQEIIKPIQEEMQALINNIKEIYDMLADIGEGTSKKEYDNLSLEEKI